jgi:hypothetical protein
MRTTLEIKRIELFSLFKVAFVLYAAVGLVAGLFYGFFLIAASFLGTALAEEGFPDFGIFGGLLGLVLIPVISVFYGAIGSVFVTIIGALYNIFAGVVGGVRFEAEAEPVQTPPPPTTHDESPTIDTQVRP